MFLSASMPWLAQLTKCIFHIHNKNSRSIRWMCSNRNSHRRCCIKKGAFKNFAKLSGKHLSWSLFLYKVASLSHIFYTEHLRANPDQETWTTSTFWDRLQRSLLIFTVSESINIYFPWNHQKHTSVPPWNQGRNLFICLNSPNIMKRNLEQIWQCKLPVWNTSTSQLYCVSCNHMKILSETLVILGCSREQDRSKLMIHLYHRYSYTSGIHVQETNLYC